MFGSIIAMESEQTVAIKFKESTEMKKNMSNAMLGGVLSLAIFSFSSNALAQASGTTAAGTSPYAGSNSGAAGVNGSGGIGAGAAGSGLSGGPSGSIAGPGRSAPDKSATVN